MDRRAIWAIIIMMVIAIVPSFLLKSPPKPAAVVTPAAGPSPVATPAAPVPTAGAAPAAPGDTLAAAPVAKIDTIAVRSPLYVYGFTTRGGRLVHATLPKYTSMAPSDSQVPVELIPAGSSLLDGSLVVGRDTVPLSAIDFTPSVPQLDLTEPGAAPTLTFTGARGPVGVQLIYTFHRDDYRFDVRGALTGIGPNGGQLILSLGDGIRETEHDTAQNALAAALVTKAIGSDAKRTDFAKLTAGATESVSGPFEWAAVKSKYFVTAVLTVDSTGTRLSGASAAPPATAGKRPHHAKVVATLPVPASGQVSFTVYAGPIEYKRLAAIGHDFDDVNPYGWPGFRGVIRFFSTPVRWLLVFMHEKIGLQYGLALVAFGLLVRIILWPLNQKAMRAGMAMQAVQPQLQELQAKYKSDPARMQQEQMKLFREHNVNPLGGCWPMLLPWPVLLALFFVFQNSIELRGVAFLWLPDLSRPDPLYIIPVLMGLSTFGLTKVGQLGMEPNPQMKIMLYFFPVMLTVMFLNFASGLNLYYMVSNVASIPQQWLVAKERLRRAALLKAPVVVGTKKEPATKKK